MREIILDGTGWTREDDFYNSFFAAVGAPANHERTFYALRDSIEGRGINAIETPYRVLITNARFIEPSVRRIAWDFMNLSRRLFARGCRVEVDIVDRR